MSARDAGERFWNGQGCPAWVMIGSFGSWLSGRVGPRLPAGAESGRLRPDIAVVLVEKDGSSWAAGPVCTGGVLTLGYPAGVQTLQDRDKPVPDSFVLSTHARLWCSSLLNNNNSRLRSV